MTCRQNSGQATVQSRQPENKRVITQGEKMVDAVTLRWGIISPVRQPDTKTLFSVAIENEGRCGAPSQTQMRFLLACA